MRASFLVLTSDLCVASGKSVLMKVSRLALINCSRLACSASLFLSKNSAWGEGGRGREGGREGEGREGGREDDT